MILISLTGRAQNGKTTAAKAIIREALLQGLTAEIFEISSYILAQAIEEKLLPEGSTRENLDSDGIKVLVDLGAAKRKESPNYWIDKVFADMDAKQPDVALLPNLRFLDEESAIRNRGGKIIRVVSLIDDGIEFVSPDRDANDRSETEHYRICAQYFISTKRGESALLGKQAATLFNYLWGKHDS